MEETIHLDKKMFEEMKKGNKKFEIRLGNMNIQKGDTLKIIKRDIEGNPTAEHLNKKITNVTKTKELSYWTEEQINKHGFTIMSLE